MVVQCGKRSNESLVASGRKSVMMLSGRPSPNDKPQDFAASPIVSPLFSRFMPFPNFNGQTRKQSRLLASKFERLGLARGKDGEREREPTG